MEFTVDKSFYDSDLKELWDSDLMEPVSVAQRLRGGRNSHRFSATDSALF